ASRVVHLVGRTTAVSTPKSRARLPSYFFEARRRYFLKNHGPLYAAMTDFALITGLVLCRLRLFISGRKDTGRAHLIRDYVSHSVFFSGFKLNDVQNPALASKNH